MSKDVVAIDTYRKVRVCLYVERHLMFKLDYKIYLLIIAHNIVACLLKLFASFTDQKRKEKKNYFQVSHLYCGSVLLFKELEWQNRSYNATFCK